MRQPSRIPFSQHHDALHCTDLQGRPFLTSRAYESMSSLPAVRPFFVYGTLMKNFRNYNAFLRGKARKARLKEYLRENTKIFYEDKILLDDFSNFIHRISRVGSGSAADDSKAQKNAANAISLPEERVAHFFFKEHGHTIPKRKKKRRKRKE